MNLDALQYAELWQSLNEYIKENYIEVRTESAKCERVPMGVMPDYCKLPCLSSREALPQQPPRGKNKSSRLEEKESLAELLH